MGPGRTARTARIVVAAGLLVGTTVVAERGVRADDKLVIVAGSLQSELGCGGDWDPGCTATQLAPAGADVYRTTFAVPAGTWEFKITVGGTWDENYGLGGVPNGSNIPLTIAGPAEVVFTYDDTTNLTSVVPARPAGDRVTRADRQLAGDSLRNRLTREQFYFVMTDRFANGNTDNDLGGLTGDRLATGFDPADKGFYHGGDLRGLIDRLDYIQSLGTTAIWLTPSFANKPVQGSPGNESAGYHGYWITDFTRIDPHLGTNAELTELIDTAHAMGMKVFFDIITNHTADVIDYEEGQYTYISKEASPYTDAEGNEFDDRDYVNSPEFPEMNVDGFPYTPIFNTPEDADAKFPDWLDDPTLYHNRGDSTFAGESSEYGDFIGLDDLFTEHPAVQQGMEEIYQVWVDFGIDGFRIDTAKHVNLEFWQSFGPAMHEHAASLGNDDFFMFGEVFDANPVFQSIYSTAGALSSTLDFGFQQVAVAVTNGDSTALLADLYAGDDYYTDTDSNAYNLPTFLGNHDMGRIGRFVGGDLQKDLFAHALMFTLRGQPVVYYGDEQGFIGDGGDKDARQDMFASQVASYNDDLMIGAPGGAIDRYGTDGPVFQAIAELSALRAAHPALQDGAQIPRFSSDGAGIFAVSRIGEARHGQQTEYLVVANNAGTPMTATFATATEHGKFQPIYGGGSRLAIDHGRVTVTVPPMTVQVFRAQQHIKRSHRAPEPVFMTPLAGGVVGGRAEIRAGVPTDQPVDVTYTYRVVGEHGWHLLGTDDNAPYRVFHDTTSLPAGTLLEYRAIVRDNAGNLSVDSTFAGVGDAPPETGGGAVGDVEQPSMVTVPGSANSEMGCTGDWDPGCAAAALTLDPNDEIWKGTFTLPAGPYAYKVAIDGTWDENYGAGAVRNGADIPLTSTGEPISFYYDHRTHFVTTTAETDIVVAAGSFQAAMGCASDWDPTCMRSWLQDPDGDGVHSLATTQIPAGSYEVKATVGLSWDENYGAGGVPDGDNVTFVVPADGMVTTLAFDSATNLLAVAVTRAAVVPDLDVAEAVWLSERTIGYPVDRIPAGIPAEAFHYRVHWGADLAVDDATLGGHSTAAEPVRVGDGYLVLELDHRIARELRRRPPALLAVGVSDDAGRLVDATAVGA